MRHTIELTPRLRTAADLVPAGARLADIGTDHAYLPAALLLEGKIPFAIAADLRHGPLLRAKETARQYGCQEKMAFRLCDGLRGIRPEETDAVVIAGMGGETIAQILQAAPWVRERRASTAATHCSTPRALHPAAVATSMSFREHQSRSMWSNPMVAVAIIRTREPSRSRLSQRVRVRVTSASASRTSSRAISRPGR